MPGQHKLFQRQTLLSVSKNRLSFSHKDPDGESEIPLLSSQSTAFTQNSSRCQQMVSREELGIKLSSGCGWCFFMPGYPNKGSEPEARSASAKPQQNWAWECAGLGPTELLPQRRGQFLSASRLLFWQLSLLHPPGPCPKSSSPFLPQCGRSPTHTDWQHCKCCFTYLCLFSLVARSSCNDSLFSLPLPSENKKNLLRRVVQLYWSFLMSCYGK